MADVFISYKSDRRPAAEHLAEILADYGYSVWWDYALISGRDFGAQIEQELRASKAVIVLWCSLSVQSEWVREEAGLAKRLDKAIPARIDKVDLPLGFSLSQTLDLSDWDGAPQSKSLDRLLREVGRLVGRAPAPNLDGLDRTERSWRRFGAPPLREFALIDALERKSTPRTLPGALMPTAEAPAAAPARPASLDIGATRTREAPAQSAGVPAIVFVIAGIAITAMLGVAAWSFMPKGSSNTAASAPDSVVASVAAPIRLSPMPSHASMTTPSMAERVQPMLGSWRLQAAADCRAPYRLQVKDQIVTLTAPDGTAQDEQIDTMSGDWMRTVGAKGVRAFYKLDGDKLTYRYSDINDASADTVFVRCG